MPISKIKSSSITADAASTNLNIDAGTLFLDTTNNRVGVGNTAPDVKLQVTDTIDVGIAMSNSSSVTTGNRGSLAMFNSANSTVGLIRFGAVTDNVGTDIQFYTRPAAGALSQTMTLTSAGNLGIGTTNPQFKFHVRGADATSLFVVGNTTEDTRLEVSTYQDDRIVLRANDSSNTARSIAFETGLNERMRITSSGAVGIATSDPAASLDVATSSGSAGQVNTHIMLSRGTSTGAFLQTERAAASNNVSALILGVNSAERMRVTDAGKVGIGTVSPVAQLDIENSSAQPFGTAAQLNAVFKGSVSIGQGGAIGFDYFGNHTNAPTSMGYAIESQAGSTKGSLVFGTRSVTTDTAPTERMRITSAGNVGIGTTSPQDMLDVSGSARIGEGQVTSNAQVGVLGIYSGMTFNTGNAQLRFFGKSVDNTGLTYELGRISSGSLGSAYTIGGGLAFSTSENNGANVMTLSERMRITATGNISIGTVNAFSRLSVMGTGTTVGLTTDAALRIVPVSTGASHQIVFGYAEEGTYANAAIGFTATDYANYQKGHIFFANRNSTSNVAPTERVRITAPGELLIGQTTTYNGAGISIQPNLATAAVGINGNFATVWNIPTGTCGLFTVHMGGNGQYGGAALFFVTWGSAAGINNASITQIVGPQGDQSGYNWSYNLASNGQFQMRNNTNSVNFTPVINLITLG